MKFVYTKVLKKATSKWWWQKLHTYSPLADEF